MYGTLFTSPRAEPEVAALLIEGSGGREPSYLAEPLAGQGIAALSLAYFGRDGLPACLGAIELGYFRVALSWLRAQLGSPLRRVVVVGQSRGSEAALLAAIHFSDLVDAVVVTVHSNVVLGGYPTGGPAWLLDGAELPYAQQVGPDCEDPAAAISVERVAGPIMFVSAGADEIWPSAAMARAMSQRLCRHGDQPGRLLLEYPDATHSLGYLLPRLPAALIHSDLDDPAATQAARADAWPRVLRFIGQPNGDVSHP